VTEPPSAPASLFIDCRLDLGEGPIWHGGRNEFIFFDVNVGTLYRARPDGTVPATFDFGEPAAAAGIVDNERLAVFTASALKMLAIDSGEVETIALVESDNPHTRANDSRVDPTGGFWLGTMSRGRPFKEGAGSYYQYKRGKLQLIYADVSIPNSTCFSPDGGTAYFSDSVTRKIMRVRIGADSGLPIAEPEIFVDLGDVQKVPDGSVVDSEGCVWNAEYGGSRVVRYTPDGEVDRIVTLPVSQVTCPCLGGEDLKTLFITSAHQGMKAEQRAEHPLSGSCFAVRVDVPGLPETPVTL
jgi:sugar lactone lactonase YvrE